MLILAVHGTVTAVYNEGLQPVSPSVLFSLSQVLTYNHRRYLQPSERRPSGPAVKVETRDLYRVDDRGIVVTRTGLLSRIKEALTAASVEFRVENHAPEPVPANAYQSYRDTVERLITFRSPSQSAAVDAILQAERGVVCAPPGFGKSVLIESTALAYPHAKIDVVTDRLNLVHALHRRLSRRFPVGLVGDGRYDNTPRVTVYSASSLHKSPADAHFLLCDEAHELVSDAVVAELARYSQSRNFAFTASPTGRFDGADVRLTALFGDVIFHRSYRDAVAEGLVVPIEVQWIRCDSPTNPCDGARNDALRKRLGIWANQKRNRSIAEAVRCYEQEQVLILVDTVEHAVCLRQHLPEYELVYAECEDATIQPYIRRNMLPADWPSMTTQRRKELTARFERGELRKAVATGVWAVGVDFTHLQVLVRADGGAGMIRSVQLPGRVSRINEAIGKQTGILMDCTDEFDPRMREHARARYRHYREIGWEQVVP